MLTECPQGGDAKIAPTLAFLESSTLPFSTQKMDSKNFTLMGWVSTMSWMEMGLVSDGNSPLVFTELA